MNEAAHAFEPSKSADLLARRRVLFLAPAARKPHTRYLIRILETARGRWGWQIDVMCPQIEQAAFADLVKSDGAVFSTPHQLVEQPWERDPEEVAATEKKMRESEVAANLPMGRVILAGAHTIGRAFNVTVRRSPSYAIVRRILKDNGEAFRILRRFFRFADEMLAAARPDIVVAFEWATPLNFAIWMAAKRRGIPCVAFRYSKISPDQAFWTMDRLMLNATAIEQAKARVKAKKPPSDAAKAYLQEFRERPATIRYIATKWQHRMRRGFLRWHLEYARIIVREFINKYRGQDLSLREPAAARLFRYYRGLFYTYYHQRFLRTLDEVELAETKYVYFPMHKEAELAQTFQATLWQDQRNTIRTLASLLPFGYRLLVREHRFNYGQRPTRFYREMAKVPNVVLIDPFDSQFKYLRHADLIVTENGSSGWEGLVLGRRVLLLSRTFYEGACCGVAVTDPDKLNAAILEALAAPAVSDPEAHDHGLGAMIDSEREATFPMGDAAIPTAVDHLAAVLASALDSRAPQGEAAAE